MTAAPGNVFRGLFEAYPDGVLLVDGQGRVVLGNDAAAVLLGYPIEALAGLSVDALVPARAAARHAGYRQRYALAPRMRPMGTDLELMARRADGSEVMVEIALSPLRAQGQDYVVASLRGIGAYPRVQRALQRARYGSYGVQLGRIAVDSLDPEELLQRTPAVVQEALNVDAVAVYLFTPDQAELRVASSVGMPPASASVLRPADRPNTLLGAALNQRAPLIIADVAHEQRFDLPPDQRPASARSGIVVPLVDRTRMVGALAAWGSLPHRFGEDEVAFLEALGNLLSTSLRRAQAETELRHAQRMETVGQLTGGVAHDFNNLLTVILGNLQLLADQPVLLGDPLSRQLVAAATRAGQRGADLTSKLLAFARRLALDPSAVDPIAVLHSLADMLRRTLGENIQVTVQTPASCPRCMVDVVQLESALLNVAVNARDAMPEGGTLLLRCGSGAPTHLPREASAVRTQDAGALRPPAEWIWLSMTDTGSGMSAEVRDRAFEPFFTTKEAGRGTGLGLATVYGFVKQSHGHVELESAPGAGTSLTLYLPALAHDAPATSQSSNTDSAPTARLPSGLRVLLVEDDLEVRQVAQAFLQSLGCRVVACASGEAALIELGQRSDVCAFDLLFSDIMLGTGIDGHELAQRVRDSFPRLAVLLTSGYSRHLAGGDGAPSDAGPPVLSKPYGRHDLAQAMAQCLRDTSG